MRWGKGVVADAFDRRLNSLLMYSMNKGFSLWGENKHKADVEAARSVDKPDMKSAGFWNQSKVSTWYGDWCPWWSSGTEFLCALKIFEIWEREGSPLVSGRVLLQHAIFGLGASMVSTLFSFKDSTIHNLSWNYAKCQPLVSQTWRKPLAMLGPRSSSGDCCALLFYLFVLSMSSKSETNKGLDFVHLLVNGMIYVYIWEHLETSKSQPHNTNEPLDEFWWNLSSHHRGSAIITCAICETMRDIWNSVRRAPGFWAHVCGCL